MRGELDAIGGLLDPDEMVSYEHALAAAGVPIPR